jgi:hypothetical protein
MLTFHSSKCFFLGNLSAKYLTQTGEEVKARKQDETKTYKINSFFLFPVRRSNLLSNLICRGQKEPSVKQAALSSLGLPQVSQALLHISSHKEAV